MTQALHRSYLYVPANDGRRVAKAYASGADAIILDLEDAVPPDRKDAARAAARELLADRPPKPTYVRVNGFASRRAAADIAAIAHGEVAGIRLPKCEGPEQVRRAARASGGLPLHLLIESATGVELAYTLATASDSVAGISLGEADLRADLRAGPQVDNATLDFARGRVVVAGRAAGLPPPVQSVFTAVRDLDGLRASCVRGRAMGFHGRSAIHPAQLDVINGVFTPTDDEIADARALIDALSVAESQGRGASVTAAGRFVDEAVVASARRTLELAHAYGGETIS
ncbi:MAG: HpcH/HpaI aldolase/citrate lyase family protein [Streptosporangiaceae bacterium]